MKSPTAGLTKIMIGQLIHMLTSNGTAYADYNDRTLAALRVRGLVGFSRGGKYGKAHWTLTDAGTDMAKHAYARKRGLPHAVFLSPTLYEAARRAGANMLDYVILKPVPTAEVMPPGRWSGAGPVLKHLDERSCPDDNCMPGHHGKCTACGEEN